MSNYDQVQSETRAAEVDPLITALDLIDSLFLDTPVVIDGENGGVSAHRIVQDMSAVLKELIDFAL